MKVYRPSWALILPDDYLHYETVIKIQLAHTYNEELKSRTSKWDYYLNAPVFGTVIACHEDSVLKEGDKVICHYLQAIGAHTEGRYHYLDDKFHFWCDTSLIYVVIRDGHPIVLHGGILVEPEIDEKKIKGAKKEGIYRGLPSGKTLSFPKINIPDTIVKTESKERGIVRYVGENSKVQVGARIFFHNSNAYKLEEPQHQRFCKGTTLYHFHEKYIMLMMYDDGYKAYDNKILVRQHPARTYYEKTGIIIDNDYRKIENKGIVVSVGGNCKKIFPDDEVAWQVKTGTKMKADGHDYMVLEEEDIALVLNNQLSIVQ